MRVCVSSTGSVGKDDQETCSAGPYLGEGGAPASHDAEQSASRDNLMVWVGFGGYGRQKPGEVHLLEVDGP